MLTAARNIAGLVPTAAIYTVAMSSLDNSAWLKAVRLLQQMAFVRLLGLRRCGCQKYLIPR